jgi:glycosyltransferase involved in cell wall biosynthesis
MSVVHGWGLAPNLFDLDKANPQRIRDELGISADTPLIGSTTRIAPNKGQDRLIRALPKVVDKYPNLVCVILGGRYDADQVYRGQLEALARELGVDRNVRFLGERMDTADIFAAYDVAVHLPDVDYLPFGILECMALGKACLCTRVGGISSVITDGVTGTLVDVENPNGIVAKLLGLLADPTLRKRLGDAARIEVLERYDLDLLVERVKRMYGDSLEGRLKQEYGGEGDQALSTG